LLRRDFELHVKAKKCFPSLRIDIKHSINSRQSEENMYRFTTIIAMLGSAAAFGDGPICESHRDTKKQGNCIKVTDCTTNEWSFGTKSSPVCDEPGSDYKEPNTKVCCFDKS
jgi:hypothetical protein